MLVPITDIRPHPENYKTHPKEQLQILKSSLKAFGWTTPIRANLKGDIVAGHGMYMTALEEGYTHVPVEYVALDDNLSKAYLVADNETARKGITDQDKLSSLLEGAAQIPDFDIEATGFDLEDLEFSSGITEKLSEEMSEEEAEQAVKDYIKFDKNKINIFHAVAGECIGCLNHYNYLFSYTQGENHIKSPFPEDSILFLDSGALSGVLKYGPEFVSLQTQEKIVRYAEEMGAHWVTMLDIPMIPQVLGPLKKTKDEAYQIHIRNAKAFKSIETDVRKVYVIQGPEFSDFKRCCLDLKNLITENDVVAIGTLKTRANDSNTIEKITALVKSHFPLNDIHLFGVTSPETVARCILVGATSCDSASASIYSRTGCVATLNSTDGSWTTKQTKLSTYCGTEKSISQTLPIWLGGTITSMFNITLAIFLELQKLKEGIPNESN